jgi:hypothetical protein
MNEVRRNDVEMRITADNQNKTFLFTGQMKIPQHRCVAHFYGIKE